MKSTVELDIDLPQQQLAALFAEISAVPVLPNGGGLRARITDQPNSDWTVLLPLPGVLPEKGA